MVLSFPWKRESSLVNSCGFRIKCGMTGPKAHLKVCYLKKQSQYENCQIGVSSYVKGHYGKNRSLG